MKLRSFFISAFVLCLPFTAISAVTDTNAKTEKDLYVVGYAHLDTQWRWDYEHTIDTYILDTLDGNFELLEKYPEYVFNFTGSSRYQMMKEYYPEKYEKVKEYIAEGRWFVSGSSVDECDVLIPSPESILRQVLYGNQFFREEFGKESVDFMLPDCFGFPAYLPSLWNHCGLLGFSTQKLSWNSTVGVPFNVGIWEGPDGNSVVGALNATAYTSSLPERQDINSEWVARMERNGEATGVYKDYRYYGVGDMGGAPREEDVENAIGSLNNPDSILNVKLTSSDQMYRDLTQEQKDRLPRYNGELMLTEHSAGVATSKAYMKRMNRKNEYLANAAETAASIASWMGAVDYPAELIKESWKRVLVSQMHDIIPGTSLQRCYEYSWNDELLAANGFASVVTNAVSGISRSLDTRVKGQAIVLYNALAYDREDLVNVKVSFPEGAPEFVRVYDERGKEVPCQVVNRIGNSLEVLLLAKLDSVSTTVYDVRASKKPYSKKTGLKIGDNTLENDYYVVTINDTGDIASVYDKKAGVELLSEPATLEFHRSVPTMYPSWNLDWKDRSLPALGKVEGPTDISVVENGPARIALEVKRQGMNSYITQRICLSAGDSGKRVEIHNDIDWQSKEVILKAAFPLTVHDQSATYTQGMGVVRNGNNNPKKYEYLSHGWFDLTDESGDYGVSVLEDCKFGSDKPEDNIIRLSLLYTPACEGTGFYEQRSQDWGRHEFVYALYGHERSWQQGKSQQQAGRLNQPVMAFQVPQHKGKLGKSYALASLNTEQVDIKAVKKAENNDMVIVRLQELIGDSASDVTVTLGDGIVSGYEVDGQERKIAGADIRNGKLHLDMTRFSIRSFALKLGKPEVALSKPVSKSVDLPYNVIAFTADKQGVAGSLGTGHSSMPAEEIPAKIVSDSITFELVNDQSAANAVACKGQTLKLPSGNYNKVYILASADKDVTSSIRVGAKTVPFAVQSWTGFVGQWDRRVWNREHEVVDYSCPGWVVDIIPGYIKRDQVAWFTTHRHDSDGKNEPYHFGYMFKYGFDLVGNEKEITLPADPTIKVFAVTVADDKNLAVPACDLYDNFDNREEVSLRIQEGGFEYKRKPLGKVDIQKAEDFDSLTLCKPSSEDYADQSAGNGVVFKYYTNENSIEDAVGPQNGAADNYVLSLINNGVSAKIADDPDNSTFFDGGLGLFIADLKKSVKVSKVNTFSCHPWNRVRQGLTVWATNRKIAPDEKLAFDERMFRNWDYIASVDTAEFGEGGVNASSITFPDGKEYRYIMWITDINRQGTFLNEIDVITK